MMKMEWGPSALSNGWTPTEDSFGGGEQRCVVVIGGRYDSASFILFFVDGVTFYTNLIYIIFKVKRNLNGKVH